MSKHFKFKLFFNVKPDPSAKSMAHVGSSSCQRTSNSTLESIRVKTKACACSNNNPKSNISFGMEPSDSLKPPAKKKPRRFYEKTCVFQDTWACHFPWVEFVIWDDGLVSQVQCTICNKILRKPKLLAPKLDMLQKHVGQHK